MLDLGKSWKAAAAAMAVALAVPILAHADSIVYISDGDVFRASPKGKDKDRITRNGSPGKPYSGVAQDSDGGIAASRFVTANCEQSSPGPGFPLGIICTGQERVQLFKPNGKEKGKPFDPNPCQDPMTDLDVSPNGKFIAFETGVGGLCGLETEAVAVVSAKGKHKLLSGATGCKDPEFFDNKHLLASCGFSISQLTVGSQRQVNWIDNGGTFFQSAGSPALAPRGDRLAWAPLGFDRTSFLVANTGGPPNGAVKETCQVKPAARVAALTWAPDGSAVAFEDSDGDLRTTSSDRIVVADLGGKSGKPKCSKTRTVIRNAADPDWGKAKP